MPPKTSVKAPVVTPASVVTKSAPTKATKVSKKATPATTDSVSVEPVAPVVGSVVEPVVEQVAPVSSPAPVTEVVKKEVKKRVPKAAPVADTVVSTKKQPKKKDPKDPNEPKRYCSAYILYSNDHRQKVKAANPGASATEVMKLLGTSWNAADAETKALYEEKSAADKAVYEGNMATYNAAHPSTDAPKVKRAPSAYILFSTAQREAVKTANPGASATEVMKLLGVAWTAADAETKAKYEALAAEERIRCEAAKNASASTTA